MTLAVKYDTTTGEETSGYITEDMLDIILNDDKHYIHDQASAATVWTISHNLGKRPSVTTLNSSNVVVFGHVEHIDNNNLTVTFKYATIGKAYCN
jgi:hypothetical protein